MATITKLHSKLHSFIENWLPFIALLIFILLSIALDGVSAYDISLPLGWLSNPSEALLTPGCS